MSLSEYIKTLGNRAAANLFNVSEGTAKSWRYGYRKPSTDLAQRIIERTGGKVGWDEIYGQFADTARAVHSAETSS